MNETEYVNKTISYLREGHMSEEHALNLVYTWDVGHYMQKYSPSEFAQMIITNL